MLLLLLLLRPLISQGCWQENQRTHKFSPPSYRLTHYITNCLEPGEDIIEALLDPLMMPRTPGSQGNKAARDHIVSHMSALGWTVELDTFTTNTVLGSKTFTNILATLHPSSPRRMVVAAHYDTKVSPAGFVGATDSAVPCAMMLHLASSLTPLLTNTSSVPEVSLQLVFFDGEEAFVSWSATDSLYGSRHLAEKLDNTPYQATPGSGFCQTGSATDLSRVDLMLLLDLLGAPRPSFQRYTQFNTSFYNLASQLEQSLLNQDSCWQGQASMFTNRDRSYMVQDDHVPFYQRGLRNILHMIASPFPSVWHTIRDDKGAIDLPTVSRLNKLVRLFVYSYLQ